MREKKQSAEAKLCKDSSTPNKKTDNKKKVRVELDDKSKLTNIIKDIFIPRAGKGAGKSRKR